MKLILIFSATRMIIEIFVNTWTGKLRSSIGINLLGLMLGIWTTINGPFRELAHLLTIPSIENDRMKFQTWKYSPFGEVIHLTSWIRGKGTFVPLSVPVCHLS